MKTYLLDEELFDQQQALEIKNSQIYQSFVKRGDKKDARLSILWGEVTDCLRSLLCAAKVRLGCWRSTSGW